MSMRDWAVHIQLEALLGHALELRERGSRISRAAAIWASVYRVDTPEGPPMPCTSCTKYVTDSLRAHGRDPNPLATFGPAAPWPELDAMSLDELHTVRYAGLDLGQLVEIPTKWFLLADALPDDPLGAPTYRSFLRSARPSSTGHPPRSNASDLIKS